MANKRTYFSLAIKIKVIVQVKTSNHPANIRNPQNRNIIGDKFRNGLEVSKEASTLNTGIVRKISHTGKNNQDPTRLHSQRHLQLVIQPTKKFTINIFRKSFFMSSPQKRRNPITMFHHVITKITKRHHQSLGRHIITCKPI
ncbi:hypothetical protein CO613_03540 [Lysobacteraceae bacterium NML07-0707]|nr:hypothetical protein CO613_03540 [Xanthomonadaceae bacterium NML07-0707]